jgi:hypothetical protein
MTSSPNEVIKQQEAIKEEKYYFKKAWEKMKIYMWKIIWQKKLGVERQVREREMNKRKEERWRARLLE